MNEASPSNPETAGPVAQIATKTASAVQSHQPEPAQPPTGEQPAQDQPVDTTPEPQPSPEPAKPAPGPVPYDRFSEVVKEKNEFKERLATLEAKLAKPAQPSLAEKAAAKLAQRGVDPSVAPALGEVLVEIAGEAAHEKLTPFEQAQSQREMADWLKDFKKEHKDYDSLKPQMYEVYSTFSPKAQELIVSDPKSMELLYSHVKRAALEKQVNEAYQKGVDDAYANRATKAAVSSTPSSATPAQPKLTPEYIESLSMAEYKALEQRYGGVNGLIAALNNQGG